jgi:hypothetical protein
MSLPEDALIELRKRQLRICSEVFYRQSLAAAPCSD